MYSVPKKNVVAYKLTVRSNFSIVQVLQHCTLNEEENKKSLFFIPSSIHLQRRVSCAKTNASCGLVCGGKSNDTIINHDTLQLVFMSATVSLSCAVALAILLPS